MYTMQDRIRLTEDMRSLPFRNRNIEIEVFEVEEIDGIERRRIMGNPFAVLFVLFEPQWVKNPNFRLHLNIFINPKCNQPTFPNVSFLFGEG